MLTAAPLWPTTRDDIALIRKIDVVQSPECGRRTSDAREIDQKSPPAMVSHLNSATRSSRPPSSLHVSLMAAIGSAWCIRCARDHPFGFGQTRLRSRSGRRPGGAIRSCGTFLLPSEYSGWVDPQRRASTCPAIEADAGHVAGRPSLVPPLQFVLTIAHDDGWAGLAGGGDSLWMPSHRTSPPCSTIMPIDRRHMMTYGASLFARRLVRIGRCGPDAF